MQPVRHTVGARVEGLQSLKFRQREEVAEALAACPPLPALSRLAPYLTAQQLEEVYQKFTSVDISEFQSLEQSHKRDQYRIGETSALDALEYERSRDAASRKKFPTFELVSQQNAEQVQIQRHDKASQTEMQHAKPLRRRTWRRFLCQGSLMKSALRKNNTVYQLPLENKFPEAETPTDCSNGWIQSGEYEGSVDLPSSQSPTLENLENIKSRLGFGNDLSQRHDQGSHCEPASLP